MIRARALLAACSFVAALARLAPAAAQSEPVMDAGTLAHALDRVASTARVLYVAAHPDDENTRLLAYLANARHVTAAYLSMTRGGGGQNLIGVEQAELLDVIRTEELLAARRLDGAVQRFTRMRDFGFSKSAAETLAIWDHDEALADVVWVIRTFQPDVIVTRFDELPPNHGHHTASAILAREAFAAAADPARFPEQLRDGVRQSEDAVRPWRATRLLWNVSTWTDKPVPKDALPLDVGAYDARLGLGYGELAALSRSQHKSQGFGVPGERGVLTERFVTVAGSRPAKDILDGVDPSWARIGKGGAAVDAALREAARTLERDRPERALPALAAAARALDRLPDAPRVRDARAALADVIAAAAGLFVRATAAQPMTEPGGTVDVKVEIALRRPAAATLVRLTFPGVAAKQVATPLAVGAKQEITQAVPIAADAPLSTPYWLATPSLAGRQVADQHLVGAPSGPPALAVAVELEVGGRPLRLTVPVVYVWKDQVHGERVRRFLVAPPATVTPLRDAVMFPNGAATVAALRVRAARNDLAGEVALDLPAGWRSEPARAPVQLAKAGDETVVRFTVTPPKDAAAAEIHPTLTTGGRAWSLREDVIDYAHLPMQVVLQPASLRLVPLALRLPKGAIGYVQGSGDTVASDLTHVGLTVETLDDEMLANADLDRWAAIVVGVRAYNTRAALRNAHARLMQYVADGGTVVVQYVTNNRLAPLDTPIGPYQLTIGRDRVTDERAAMTALDPQQPVLRAPNAIGPADFDGWVQERGLYYAETWDPRYTPVIRAADPDEKALDGGLLVARHGKGRYVYTGLAFFRQLPAGVPGAYRLFANLLARD